MMIENVSQNISIKNISILYDLPDKCRIKKDIERL